MAATDPELEMHPQRKLPLQDVLDHARKRGFKVRLGERYTEAEVSHATLDNGRSLSVFYEDSEDCPVYRIGPVRILYNSDTPDEKRLADIQVEMLSDLGPVLEWLSEPWENATWPGMVEGNA